MQSAVVPPAHRNDCFLRICVKNIGKIMLYCYVPFFVFLGLISKPVLTVLMTITTMTTMTNIWEIEERKRSFSIYYDLLRNKLYYWAVAIETSLADPKRHIKKKQLRDISNKIRRIQLRMHNRKAKCYIPELLVELNSLFKQRDTIRNGYILRTRHTPKPQKICSVCNYRIDKGYHICKSHPSRPLQPQG